MRYRFAEPLRSPALIAFLRTRRPRFVAVLVVAVLGVLWPGAKLQKLSSFDQPFYLGIAYDIVHHGRFTDGYMFAATGRDGLRPSGMRFAPLVPALLAGAWRLDPAFARDATCTVLSRGRDASCGHSAALVRGVQFAMLAAALWAIYPMALAAGLAPLAAAGAVLLGLLAGPLLLGSVNTVMTEIPTFFFTTLGTWALVRAAARGTAADAIGAGIAFGLAALARPAFLYLPLATLPVLAWSAHGTWRRRLACAAASGLATAATVAPWILRNALVLGRAQLSFGYAGHTLAQRISFDRMTLREYGLSYLCWLPDGNGLGRLLVGPQACARFGWDERPDTFYAIGMRRLVPQTLHAAGSVDNLLPWLLHHEILPHLGRHLATTLPLALRGLWIDHYWGLVLGPLAIAVAIGALRRRSGPLLALTIPPFFMLALNASVAVNQARYNLMLVPALAISGAQVGARLLSRSGACSASGRRSAHAPPPHRPDPSRSRCPEPLRSPPRPASFPFPRRGRGPPRRRRRGA